MAKKKVTKKEMSEQEKKEFELRQLRERISFIPDPTYRFNIGDKVSMGNLEDVVIHDIYDDGKIYEIDYTSVKTNYGNPIRNEHQKMYTSWLNVRKLNKHVESLIKNDDIRLYYSQRSLSDLLSKTYHFGVNFEPEYQREFVWDLEDKVALIDSIFNNVDIGKFTFIRNNDKEYLETGFSYEVLDGKQRMRAILDFYEDRFEYKGKYFSNLSHRDKYHIRDYPISIAEVDNLTEEQVLRYFIKLNTSGRVMSKEHIDKVKKILEETC